VILAVVAPESVIGNAVAVVSATLLPSAVLRLPAMRTITLPGDLLYAYLLRAAPLCGPVVVLLLSLLALLVLLPSGLLLLFRGVVPLLLLLTLLILLPLSLLLLFRGVVPLLLLPLLILLPLGLLLLFRGVVPLLLLPLLILLPLGLLLLPRGIVPLLLLLLLFRSLSLLLLTLLLLLFLFRSLSLLLLTLLLLFRSLSLLLSFRFSLLLLFPWLSLFFLLLLAGVSRSSDSDQQKNRCQTNDSNSFHGVTSIASTCAPLIRPIRRVNCQACARFNSSRAKTRLFARHPTRIREREWNNPNTLRSHNTTPMTTTPFKIDLMLPAMGMKRFTSHNRTPTTIRVNRICMRGMLFYLSVFAARHSYIGPTNCFVLCPAGRTG